MKKVISVRFKENGKSYYFDPAGADIKTGEYVIVETARGVECGEVVQGVREIADAAVPKALKPITRMADSVDIRRMRQNREDEKRAYRTCQECIARHGLEMKLVEAEYTLDRSKIMFYFTADGRVDFRELVKDLAGIFHTRIELRQIGVRDESKMIGGLGICGQPFCCSRFLKDFQPVSIKMAKEQGLSLNPTKISGACGRLMCCLAYEESAYEYLNSIMPMVGSTVRTPDGLGTVLEVNPVSGYLRVRCGTESLSPRYYKVGVCEYISGGKRAPAARTRMMITPAYATRPRWWLPPTMAKSAARAAAAAGSALPKRSEGRAGGSEGVSLLKLTVLRDFCQKTPANLAIS